MKISFEADARLVRALASIRRTRRTTNTSQVVREAIWEYKKFLIKNTKCLVLDNDKETNSHDQH